MKILTYIAEFDGVRTNIISFQAKKSWETLIDTATVNTVDEVKEGTEVKLYGGYNTYDLIFSGIVTKSEKKENTYELNCEDNNTLLKNETVTLSFKGGSLKELLSQAGINAEINIKATLGKYRFVDTSKLEILNNLKKQGIQSFLRNDNLIVGVPYLDVKNSALFTFYGKKNEVISNNIQKTSVDLKKLVIQGINIKSDNTKESLYCYWKNDKIEFSKTKPKGQIKTLYFYDLSESKIKDRLSNYITQKISKGITGTFDTFVHKLISPEYTLTLNFENETKKVLVKSVEYSFGTDGGKQKIEIDYEIS